MPPRDDTAEPQPRRDLLRPGGLVDLGALRRAVHGPGAGAGRAADGGAPAPADTPANDDLLPIPEAGEGSVAEAAGDEDAPNRVVFSLRRDLQKRLDKYLTDRIPFMSRTQLQRLIDEGGVTVNGRAPKASTKLGLGDRVEVFIPAPPAHEVPPQDIPLDVLYEDEHLIVINKDPDLIVHPARSHLSGTMINALAFHFQHRSRAMAGGATGAGGEGREGEGEGGGVGPTGGLSTVGREFARPGVVHRLDRNTSGAIVFAKDDEAHWKLARQFERRTVDKRYLAITHGHVEPAIDVIDLPLGPHPSREKGYREKYVVRHDHLGKGAVTIYRVLGRYGVKPPPDDANTERDPRCSVVEVELKTGRTHQIRVHFSHLGFPLVADDMYGGRAHPASAYPPSTHPPPAPAPGIARQCLHAALLKFRHPITDTPMTFTAPLPRDLADFLHALRERPDKSEPTDPPPGSVLRLDDLLRTSAPHG